jgi:hypothetical protein
MNSSQIYDAQVRGVIAEEGPCSLRRIATELRVQTEGEWSSPGTALDIRRYYSEYEAVQALNRLQRAGVVELYDTGDAWVLAERK